MADGAPRKETRIQAEKRELIREAALDVFSRHGFRGSTLDQIAEAAGLSKPNLLYYFESKDAIHRDLLERLLDTWLDPLRELDGGGDPVREIRGYIQRKLEAARDYPRESRLFANEIIQGAPRIADELQGPLRELVDEKSAILRRWMAQGRLARMDPHHLIFAIWAITQHYADFDVQVRAVLGSDDEARFHDAAAAIEMLFFRGLLPR
ncbi:TetR family transcriptional regulator C-terminal domain-containing protein [Pontivivens ytuae]|uniref:TetR family transcriptional regulator C-terminal domain-containing protein n=1 Tax=Pontivivens ytuae TaxID=2789856 RepID=A0A7S9LNK2_9RHOB|nr:TetR family transcriptional regulator C-terminal domain-containing protein [Pontivivens ytuae]QPH52384.1 TetR family transcriptional regulator C-terminal domain-containing protein [Pontivivens ytuae]